MLNWKQSKSQKWEAGSPTVGTHTQRVSTPPPPPWEVPPGGTGGGGGGAGEPRGHEEVMQMKSMLISSHSPTDNR